MKKDSVIDEKCKRVQEKVRCEGEPVLLACKIENVSRATYYKWRMQQKDKNLMKNESGVSYPLFIIILTFIIGTACYIILLPAINIISVAMNTFIADGVVSVQTQDAYNFNLNLYKIMPLFLMIGLFLYAITQALLRKGTEG
jgi:type II secretory pathway component PulF